MKQYKHIPTGWIFTQLVPESINYFNKNVGKISSTIVESGKDWQEIVNKKPEYTILSFKETGNSEIIWWSYGEPLCFVCSKRDEYEGNGWFVHMMLQKTEQGLFEINSVRRESDGEIFKVGDEIIWGTFNLKTTITGFKIQNGVLYITFDMLIKSIPLCWNYKVEKVKPKEWEITAFIRKQKSSHQQPLIKKESDGNWYECWGNFPNCTYNGYKYEDLTGCLLKSITAVEIYSVKRLSDSIEFKLGNLARVDAVSGCSGQDYITKFKIGNESYLYNGLPYIEVEFQEGGWNYLNNLKHTTGKAYPKISTEELDKILSKKEKLFTTEDGVDIYEGDKTYGIHLDTLEPVFDNNLPWKSKSCPLAYHKHFSTKQAAEEYILMNKPLLTVKECNELFNKFYFDKSKCFKQLTEEFVKSKL